MKQPVTELETRFSDRDAVATDWEEARRALDDAELFWISTVRADGRPHATPLVAVWLDDTIYFATGPSEQKAVNLRTNQNVILTTGCNEWERGLDVVVEGEAVQVIDVASSNASQRRGRRNGTVAGTTRCTTAASGTRVGAARSSSTR